MDKRILTNNNCRLIGNTLGYVIQLLLAIIVITFLLIRRHVEIPKRPIKIWCLDVGKLLIGGFFVHSANIIVSTYILNSNDSDECSWYFINFFVDCTLGVIIVYYTHKSICYVINKLNNGESNTTKIGYYNEPIDFLIWFKQNLIYLSSLLFNKIIITFLLFILRNQLTLFGNWLFTPFRDKPNLELVIVMIISPGILTTFQFWIFDIMLKRKISNLNNESEGIYLL